MSESTSQSFKLQLLVFNVSKFSVIMSVNDMDATPTSSKSWVRLNVGGKLFLTTAQTLTRVPNSFFSRLIDENSELNSDKVGT